MRARTLVLALLVIPLPALPAGAALPLVPQPAPSDAAAAPPSGPETVVDQPETIPVEAIPTRALLVQGRLRSIQAEARPAAAVLRIERELAGYLRAAEAQRAAPENAVSANRSPGELEVVEQFWLTMVERTSTWEDLLSRRVQHLQGLATEIGTMRATWESTRAAVATAAPESIVARVDATLAAIVETQAAVIARRDHVLEIAEQMLQALFAARNSLQEIDDIRAQRRDRLFARDVPPLWDLPALLRQTKDPLGAVRASLARHLATLRTSARDNAHRAPRIVAPALAFLALMYWLRRESRAWGPGLIDPATRHVVEHPVASSTMLFLLLFSFGISHQPEALRVAAGLLALAAAIPLLPGIVSREFRKPYFRVCALFCFVPLVDIADTDQGIERLIVLLFGCCALPVFLAAWRAIRREDLAADRPRSRPVRVVLAVGGAVLVGLALLANVVGMSRMAAFLTLAVVRCAFGAVLLFVLASTLKGVFAALLRTRPAQRLASVRDHGELLRARGVQWIGIAALVLWIERSLELFEVWPTVRRVGTSVLEASIEIRKLKLSLGVVLSFFAILFCATLLSRVIRFFLDEDVLPRLPLARGVPAAISLSLHYTLCFLGFLAALAAAGVSLTEFTVLGGAFGVGLAFGMQTIVNNFVSGLILLYERPIQAGDVIEIGTTTGTVERIGVRSSTVRTFDGAEVIVPNADLVSKDVTNWTLSDRRRRIEVCVGVAYGTDPERVLRLLVATAALVPDVLAQPAPQAFFTGFGESSLDFALRGWTGEFADWLRVRSDLAVAVSKALSEAGIEIPFPQRDLHVRTVTPGTASDVAVSIPE